ncbi:MAG: leucine-rich repeat domain-containing protein [Janthinobacterium lividum]
MRWTATVYHFMTRACYLGWASLLLSLCLLLSPSASWAQTGQGLIADSTEVRILHQVYRATYGDTWTNHTNWPTGEPWPITSTSADFATWYGVTVANGDVIGLDLYDNRLTGIIPASLGQLAQLQNLDLGNNRLTGTIPASLGQLAQLKLMWLGSNQLTGSIPASLGQLARLRELYLAYNQLTGSIPASLGQLGQLYYLGLFYNQLTGSIPAELGQLGSLQQLGLFNNQLSGPIPATLGQLGSLLYLNLFANHLSGTIPATLGQLHQVQDVNLYSNQLSGPIPAEFSQLRNLQYLNLNDNHLTGATLPGLGALPPLQHLRVHNNDFTFAHLEPLFTGPGKGPRTSLFMYAPQLSPAGRDTVAFTPGQTLTLRRSLGGQHTHHQWQRRQSGQWQNVAGAQDSVLTVSTASVADSGTYRVQGTNDWVTGLTLTSKAIYARPNGVDPRLQVLRELYEGTDGDHWTHHENWPSGDAAWKAVRDIRACATWYGVTLQQDSLRQISLANNNLRGHLPPSLGQLRELYILYFNANQLTESVPASLGQLRQLNILYLSHNQFTGQLPTGLGQLQALRELGIDHNQLQGQLPTDLRQLTNLQTLYLQANQFTGSFPDVLSCPNLRLLYVGENKFSGALPTGLTQLSHLTELGVNNSGFVGTVPAGLVSLPLTALYLHSNAFGDLPSWVGAAHVPANFYVHDNELDFADLEANFLGKNQPLPSFYYDPQRSPVGADTLQWQVGESAQLAGQIGGAYNRYQWQRQVDGQWVEVSGQTKPTLVWDAVSLSDAGLYRTRVTNDWVGGTTLYSRAHYLKVVPGLPLVRNLPDDTNQGLGSFVTRVDSAAWASRGTGPAPNFVRVWTPRIAVTDSTRISRALVDSVSMSTQYMDGLGRPIQTVLKQASPSKRDLVQPQAYDALGREPRQYLPYPALSQTGPAGSFRPQALREQDTFYRPTSSVSVPSATDPTWGVARTGAAYTETQFEASPLNRVLKQGAAGEAWQLTAMGHYQQRLERPNVALQDSIPRFTPTYDARSLDPGYQGYYADGELWGTQTTDEHGYRTLEWKDKLGQVVLKQVEANHISKSISQQSRWLRTAYVYDDFQRLRFVLQPEATRRVLPLGTGAAALPAAAQPYLFHYRYDGRGRQIAKQVPGQDGETLVVYDQLDRPILSQDAQQRTRKEWSWTKYDALGRSILSGLVTRHDTLSQVSLQTQATADTLTSHQYEQRSADGTTYPQFYSTDHAFPQLNQKGFGPGQVLTATYYDDYDFNNDGQPDAHYNASTDAQFAAGQAPVADEARTTGLNTRTLTRVLGVATSDWHQMAWLSTTTFYDERARPVQVQTTSARKDTATGQPYLDLLTTQLDFTGKVVQSVAVHQGPSLATPIQVAEFFTYDHMRRLLNTKQQLPGEAQPTTIAKVQYNELGQVRRKTIGTGRLQQDVDYAYNIRGWLTSLNDPYQPNTEDLFNLSLHYERGFTKGYEQYNGNLTGQTWRGRDGVQRAYGYVYDPVNRLLQGDFVARAGGRAGTLSTATAWNQELDNYRLSFVSYDDNGNINTLRRRGLLQNATHTAGQQYGAVDNLTYAYQGNRLQAVEDAVSGNQLPHPATYHGAPTSLAGDFQEASVHLSQEYGYDANGNLTQDKNKGITGITYNHLNLPRQIHFGAGADSVVFRYTASGQKVAKLVYQTGQITPKRTDYLGPYQYEQDSLKFFPHAEGRVLRFVSKNASGQAFVSYQREFTLKDHLGNLRLAYRLGQNRTYTATLEQDDYTHTRESQQFDSLSVSPAVVQDVHNIGGENLTHSGTYAAQLNAAPHLGSDGKTVAPQPLGPLTQLGVQKGDVVQVSAPGMYPQAPSSSNFFFSLASFVAGLLQPPATGSPARLESSKRGGLPLLQVGLSLGLTQVAQLSPSVPKGYLRVLIFNRDSVLVRQHLKQLSAAALHNYEELTDTVQVNQDGYVTVYVGNESPVDVFFDDVQVTHQQGLLVQENQYEPWGLGLAGLDYTTPELRQSNQYQFNGKEQERELGLNWHDFNWRHYDPATARFFGVDRLADKFVYMTDYQFASNNPTSKIELDGLEGVPSISFNQGYIENILWTNVGLPYTPNQTESIQMGVDATKFVAKEAVVQIGFMLISEVAVSYVLPEVIAIGRAGAEAAEVTQGARAAESFSQGSEISDGARMRAQPLDAPRFSGTAKHLEEGATPNSIYTKIDEKGNASSNHIYNEEGKIQGQVDFNKHRKDMPSGHGHIMTEPGNTSSGHGRDKHISPNKIPSLWKEIPSHLKPATPLGQ